jgi:hypothetical protein
MINALIAQPQIANIAGAIDQGVRGRAFDTQMRNQNALIGAVQQYGPRSPQAMNALGGVDPMRAMAMAQPDPEARQRAALGLVQGVLAAPEEQRPQLWGQALQQAGQMGLDLSGVPQQYPGEQSLRAMGALLGMKPDERTEFERLLSAVPEGQRQQAALVRLGLAPGADAVLRSGASERDPIASLRARAAEAGLRPGTPEYAQFMVSGGSAQSGLAVDFDPATGGVSVRQGVGAGTMQKPFTEGQAKDNVYSTRARGALATLEPIADSLASLGDRALDLDPTGLVRGRFQDQEYQVAKAAGDEFLQAVLRKDTGAAITSQEQQLYGVTFLPQPGDGPDALAYKAQARRRALAAIEAGMMPAQIIAQERALKQSNSPAMPDRQQASPETARIPAGLDPAVWGVMTPEERALFQ